MKKKKIILSTMLIIFLLFVTGCRNKKALTQEQFRKIMKKKNYEIVDVTKNYQQAGYVVTALLAQNKKKTYQIEFYILKNEEQAKNFYDNNKTIFTSSKEEKAKKEINLENYEKFEQETMNKWNTVSRIDNTTIYVSANKTNKKEIKKVLKDLGY